MYDIQDLLTRLAEIDGASDLYVTAGALPFIKVKGTMESQGDDAITGEDSKRMAYELMNESEQARFEEELEMNLAYLIPEKGRYRVNIFQQMDQVGMVVRIIPIKFPTFDELGLPDVCRRLCMEKRGLVLIVGATGSGKSTTMAAMIDHRNKNQDGHIITIEDPVEFVHQHHQSIITHREVGADTHAFHSALKSALRQAPDVILIGEIRDIETMEAAITFSETGHLVFGTLHANNANQTLQRIINFFPAERHAQIYLQLSLNFRAIISQRLLKKKDGSGRTACMEIMINTPRIRDLIQRGEVDVIKEAMTLSAQVGGQTFDQSLITLYDEGVVTQQMAIQESDSPNDVKILIDQLNTQRKMLAERSIHQVVDFDVTSRTESCLEFEITEDFCIGIWHAGLAATKAFDLRSPAVLLEEGDEPTQEAIQLLRIKPNPDVSLHGVVLNAEVKAREGQGKRELQFEMDMGFRGIDEEGTTVYQHRIRDAARQMQAIKDGKVVQGPTEGDYPGIWKNLAEKICYAGAQHMAATYTPKKAVSESA